MPGANGRPIRGIQLRDIDRFSLRHLASRFLRNFSYFVDDIRMAIAMVISLRTKFRVSSCLGVAVDCIDERPIGAVGRSCQFAAPTAFSQYA